MAADAAVLADREAPRLQQRGGAVIQHQGRGGGHRCRSAASSNLARLIEKFIEHYAAALGGGDREGDVDQALAGLQWTLPLPRTFGVFLKPTYEQ